MTIDQIIVELHKERDRILAAIAALGGAPKPGKRGPRGPRSAESRRQQSERMKAYWAKRNKRKG